MTTRFKLFNEGVRLFGASGLHAIVQNANPNLVQNDIDEIRNLLALKQRQKQKQELIWWKADTQQWWEALDQAFKEGLLKQ